MAQYEMMLDALRVLLAANVPVKLESLPGAGKTSYLNALFRASGGHLTTMVAVNHDPTDFGGIPAPDLANKRYDLLPGDWAQQLVEASLTTELVGIFLDEFNTAGRAVASACLKLVDEGRVGFLQLPEKVRKVLAMNPAEANGGVDLTPAMANRVAHLPFFIPEADWAEGFQHGFPDPDPLIIPSEEDMANLYPTEAAAIAQFHRVKPGMLDSYPEQSSARSGAYPTRRTWTLGAKGITAAKVLGYSEDVQSQVLGSLVSTQVADTFYDWREKLEKLDVMVVFDKGADALELPEKDDGLFAVLDAVTSEAVNRNTSEAVEAACEVLVRVHSELGRPGVAMSSVDRIAKHLSANQGLMTSGIRTALRVFGPSLEGGDWNASS